MTQPLNLDQIQARHAAATPGTWTVEWDRDDVSDIPFPTSIGPISYVEHHGERFTEDARFVEHAHDDTGLLLAEVRRLRAIEAAARTVVDLWGQQQDRELAYSDSWSGGTEPARLAYQRGATYETCRDDLLHVLEEGTVPPDYVGYDEPAAPAAEGV